AARENRGDDRYTAAAALFRLHRVADEYWPGEWRRYVVLLLSDHCCRDSWQIWRIDHRCSVERRRLARGKLDRDPYEYAWAHRTRRPQYWARYRRSFPGAVYNDGAD